MARSGHVTCIDLFCGAGGLTHGLELQGLNVAAGYDLDPACKYPYEANNQAHFFEGDVGDLTAEELNTVFGDADVRVLAGCAPCQPFSSYSQRYETVGTPRWGLLYKFADLVRQTTPEIVTMENVSNVVRHKVFEDFLFALEDMQYEVCESVVDCSDHGLAQTRRRTVLLASRMGPITLDKPDKNRRRTVRQRIGHLPPIDAGGSDPRDPLHTSAKLSSINLARIRASKPGGTWRDWPPELVAECHRKQTGKTYPGVYGRMSWDQPSPTLTTQFFGFGNGRYGHPEQDRAISLREGAILQGFSRRYAFVPKAAPVHFKALGRLIGNAVPVNLGSVIGKSINNHLGIEPKKISGSVSESEDEQRSGRLVA